MVKRANVPSGFYSGKQASDKLRMPLPTFYRKVRDGEFEKHKLKKIVPPGRRREGYYDKKIVDDIAQEYALFTLAHSIEPVTFHRAETEDDLRGIVDLCIAIYGQGGTPSYDARREIWEKNNEVYYIVRQEGIVSGYASLIWFDQEAIDTLMGPPPKHRAISSAGTGVYSITGPDHVMKFVDEQPIDHLFISLGVRPGFSNTEQRTYSLVLLRGITDVLANFAERGMPIHMLYATSERGEGIRLARKFGMEEIRYPGDNLLRYRLDVEASDNLLLHPYKQALANYRTDTTK